ncbi:amino acid adenylation domain-containing protein [Streptomyces sp. SID11233]|nr:amino acid adenylation domain-containing protein [Streptomyces sp. SID11233]
MLTTPTTPVTGPAPALVAANRKEQALWLLEELVPSSAVNNLSVVFAAEDALGEWEIQEALDALLRRHDILRTVFYGTAAGLVKQTVPAERFDVRVDSREIAGDAADEEIDAVVRAPFAFDGQPLVRAAHLQGPDGDVVCIVVHHIVFDAISSGILLEEFIEAYEGISAGLGVPDHLQEVQRPLRPAPYEEESLAYWRRHLEGFDPSRLGLSCGTEDVPEPTLTGDYVLHALSPRAHDAVRRLQRELRAPEGVVLLAAYYLLLARHGAGPDMVVGSPVSVRGPEAPRAVGYHVNTLPLRAHVDLDAGFRDLAGRAREAFFGAMTHTDVPVDALLPEIQHTGATWRNTVFRHLFNYVPDAGPEHFEIDGITARRLLIENGHSKFDLEFFFFASPQEIKIRGVFYTEILHRTDAELLLERYDDLLIALGEDPDRPMGDIPVHSARDTLVISTANATSRTVEPATLLRAVADRVHATPDATAVVTGSRECSYAAVWAAALANRSVLTGAGVAPGSVVALAGRRGPELAAAVLGTWLAGSAYVALDPDHPDRRIAHLLEDSGATAVLAAPGIEVSTSPETPVHPMAEVTATATIPAESESDLAAASGPDDTAFLVYTSGSTGVPKGTVITHRGIANVITHFAAELRAAQDDTTLWLTTFTFDISSVELFVPLISGGRIAVAPDEARTDGEALRALLTRHGVTIVQATPTTWRTVVDAAEDLLVGVRALTGGEPLPPALARKITAAGCELRNAYAPSETTVYSTSGRVPDDTTCVDIGVPIANTVAFVADHAGRELPVGVRGELCVAGHGVAAGYHGRPELTAERFAVHPVHGRYYRTGDLACWLPDGRLELHGRVDRQVKVRGNRIELGEVEAVLLEHPDVAGVAVVVDEAPSGPALVAFLVPEDGPDTHDIAGRLWQHARSALPGAAVPQEYLTVDAFPTTVSQKTDHLALTRLAARRRTERAAGGADGATAESDELVAGLLALWRELLERADIDATSNFFAHGGHSLLGAQLVQRIESRFGVTVRMVDLYNDATPYGTAARIRALQETAPAAQGDAR